MIQQAIACDDPVIFLEPKRQYHADKAELDESASRRSRCSPPASCARARDLTLLAYGPMVKTCLQSAEAAAGEGKSVEVIDLRTLSPLDMGPVYDSVRKTGRAVVAHEAHVNLGMGSEIAARITEHCFYSPRGPGPAGRRVRHAVPAEPHRGGVAPRPRPRARRRGPLARVLIAFRGELLCLTSSCPTSARASPRPRSSPGR